MCYSRGFRLWAAGVMERSRFGFSPKISTTVENTVEKRGLTDQLS